MNASLKFSFLSINGKDETEEHEIEINDFPQCFKSGRQDSFPAKFRNIGQPKQIRLKLDLKGQENEDIKWHLDHVIISKKILFHFFVFFNSDRTHRSRNSITLSISL
jgi:hypothetical protein